MLGSNCRDAFYSRYNAALFSMTSHLKILLLHVARSCFQNETSYLEIGESGHFHLSEQLVGQVIE